MTTQLTYTYLRNTFRNTESCDAAEKSNLLLIVDACESAGIAPGQIPFARITIMRYICAKAAFFARIGDVESLAQILRAASTETIETLRIMYGNKRKNIQTVPVGNGQTALITDDENIPEIARRLRTNYVTTDPEQPLQLKPLLLPCAYCHRVPREDGSIIHARWCIHK